MKIVINDEQKLWNWVHDRIADLTGSEGDMDLDSLSDYVLLLLKREEPRDILVQSCSEELFDFLGDFSKSFVQDLFLQIGRMANNDSVDLESNKTINNENNDEDNVTRKRNRLDEDDNEEEEDLERYNSNDTNVNTDRMQWNGRGGRGREGRGRSRGLDGRGRGRGRYSYNYNNVYQEQRPNHDVLTITKPSSAHIWEAKNAIKESISTPTVLASSETVGTEVDDNKDIEGPSTSESVLGDAETSLEVDQELYGDIAGDDFADANNDGVTITTAGSISIRAGGLHAQQLQQMQHQEAVLTQNITELHGMLDKLRSVTARSHQVSVSAESVHSKCVLLEQKISNFEGKLRELRTAQTELISTSSSAGRGSGGRGGRGRGFSRGTFSGARGRGRLARGANVYVRSVGHTSVRLDLTGV